MAAGIVVRKVNSLLVQEEGGEALRVNHETQLQDRAEPLPRLYRAGHTGLGARAARVRVLAARFCLRGELLGRRLVQATVEIASLRLRLTGGSRI